MVHMTMRSVKPSCLSVSAHTRPAGPTEMFNAKKENNIEKVKRVVDLLEIDPMQLSHCSLRSGK